MQRLARAGLIGALAAATVACAARPHDVAPVAVHGEVTGIPLDDAALRALLSDAIVEPGPRGGLDDGPSERFLANGIYQRNTGHGVAVDGPFEIRDNAVCVPADAGAPRCRRLQANADGSWTFTDVADGSAAVVTIRRHPASRRVQRAPQ